MFEKVLQKIKPTEKERRDISIKVNNFLKKLNSRLVSCKAVVGGSFAKGTWLKGQHDIDIFVLFRNKIDISIKLEKAIKKSFKKYERIHGSRDYFIVDFEKLSFEIIPVLNITKSEEAKNITDISPLHVDWVNKNLTEKMKEDVMVAKQFCRANNLYGAETYIKGLHGYALEILIYIYGSFENMIKNVAKWKNNLVINSSKNEFVSKQEFPLTLIDPVNPKRNATASLSREKLEHFISICREFSKSKSLRLFEVKEVNKKQFNIILEATPIKGFSDISGTKVLKVFEFITRKLHEEGFIVEKKYWEFGNKCYLYFRIENKTIQKYKKHLGPPIKLISDLEKFRKKYGGCKIEKGRAYVMIKRRHYRIKDFVSHVIKESEVKNKIRFIRIKKC